MCEDPNALFYHGHRLWTGLFCNFSMWSISEKYASRNALPLLNLLVQEVALARGAYLIPEHIGRGVRLGSESLSGNGETGSSISRNSERDSHIRGMKIETCQSHDKLSRKKTHLIQNGGRGLISRQQIQVTPFGTIVEPFLSGPRAVCFFVETLF